MFLYYVLPKHWRVNGVCVRVGVCIRVSERLRIGEDPARKYNIVLMSSPCASSDLAVYYKLVHIKIDVYVIKGTEMSQVCYGKPTIISPRPNDNLIYCPRNSHWRHIWGSLWVPHLLLLTWLLCQFRRNLKYTECLLGCGRGWSSGGRGASSGPLKIVWCNPNGSR